MEEAMKMKKVVIVLVILCATLQIGSSLIDGNQLILNYPFYYHLCILCRCCVY